MREHVIEREKTLAELQTLHDKLAVKLAVFSLRIDTLKTHRKPNGTKK
jgi:hypothetical protein